MPRRTVDLSAHINQTVERGHPADFPVTLQPLYRLGGDTYEAVPNRLAVVRQDTGQTLAVVSERYALVPHQRLLDIVQQATSHIDVGPVPRGIYVDRHGARMRALFKFPALSQPVFGTDEICPCLQLQNTYDATSRVMVHIGAFRFVCTNLAVGGGGVFAGGFMSVHSGEVPVEDVADRVGAYLTRFDKIVEVYRHWIERPVDWKRLIKIVEPLPKRTATKLREAMLTENVRTVYAAYNVATRHATHQMRSYRTAFDLLERINRGFQQQFPPSAN